jgi:hypothetical protein
MGMSDTVYVSAEVLATWMFACRECGRAPQADATWQTKSLDSCMNSYFLRHDQGGAIRLYLLDHPADRRLWRPWTEQEITESDRWAERGGLGALLRRKAGEGCFLPEAYLPENRRQRFMGELPHQWVEIHRGCECRAWVEHWIKFCDGIGAETRSEPPRHEPGFFDGAGGFDAP